MENAAFSALMFSAFNLIGDAALLHRQVRNNQIAPPVSTTRRLM
jgi:hypothetical protein